MSRTILDTIIEAKKIEVEQGKKNCSLDELEAICSAEGMPRRSLRAPLQQEGGTGIIAEFKRRSPSKGWFKPEGLSVSEVVVPYEKHGAAALSILTDQAFFGGTLHDLREARKLTGLPLLRKDFIIDAWQIAEAAVNGADVILLIAACLSPGEVARLAAYARSLGLEVLLELHDEAELAHIGPDTEIIGINNRNLKDFSVDIDRSLRMAEKIPSGKVKVAESGISDVATIRRFRQHGFAGFLVGERFMAAPDPGSAFGQFVQELRKKV
jgi:indole-3-glycerol phosphate synthase